MMLQGLRLSFVFVVFVATAGVTSLAAQQPALVIDGDKVTFRGCVSQVDIDAPVRGQALVWSRNDILLAGIVAAAPDAPNPVGTGGVAERVFYWLEDEEDLSRHVGQQVEVEGDLEDLEIGKIEIERQGDFTEIELDLDGKSEKARVPTAWLRGTGSDEDQEFQIVARRIDVDEVRVLGPCR